MTRIFEDDLRSGFGTRAIHAGQRPDPVSGAIMTPIYQTSTYVQDALGQHKGYEYARGKNPTREALERNVASLEGGRHGFAFGSGMGCLDSIMKLFRAGDHVVCGENVYGGTFRLFDKLLQHLGLRFSYVDTRDPQRIADAMTPETRAVLVETPTNPLMWLTDLRAAADVAHRGNALLIVDNTFATPYFQRPLELGADIVWHSATKYLNGHSDMVGGIAVLNDDDLATRLQFILNAAGAVPGPFDSWLVLRGTKTLHLRMRQHDANGRRVAAWLAQRMGEDRVYYPGLESHPQYALAKSQMSGFGGMISVELGTKARAAHVLERVRVFSLAESLGGVESLISLPALMTHASVPADKKDAMGMGEGLIRLSCGVEDTEDLLADLEHAFDGLPG
ncbi:trans-sulfuration enzyme family protein [Roseisolibacter agri]|uniref:Cystathionine gamma-lyase n=1 Tax=Roseisolibacter agri TaxID=2014610 RepID=A0AA37Q7H0_9BACT|nr:PLP-dependent aspartate aminotransferase family protein [Roseisolibacter agri]GLC27994.1 cystathionine gamma-lyase [Roseisolibacter agri]